MSLLLVLLVWALLAVAGAALLGAVLATSDGPQRGSEPLTLAAGAAARPVVQPAAQPDLQPAALQAATEGHGLVTRPCARVADML